MATGTDKLDSAIPDLTNDELGETAAGANPLRGEHPKEVIEAMGDNGVAATDLQRGDSIGAASKNDEDPVRNENSEKTFDNEQEYAGAGDLTRDNTADAAGKQEDNSAGGDDQLRGDNTEEKAYGSGDMCNTVEGGDTKTDTEEEWDDVLGNSLLRKKVLKPGDGRGTRPMMGSAVTIRTKTVLLDETEVDVHDSFRFILGDGDVLQALDLCVALMELHEEAVIATGYKYAWGELGRKPDIPPKADLMIYIELLQVDSRPDYSTMEVAKRITEADSKRERGNFLYRRSEYSLALNSYTKGLSIVDPEKGYSDKPEVLQQLLELRVKLLCNTAACQNKLSAHDAAIKSCEEALKLQPNNTKALYRCGKAHEGKGDKATAVKFLKLSLKHDDSNSKMVHAELSKLTKELKKESEKEKQIYQKMFGGPPVKKKEEKSLASWLWVAASGAVAAAAVSFGVYRYMNH